MVLEIKETLSEEDIEFIFKKLDPENGEKCSFISFYKNMQEIVQKKYHNT